jgi:hypothetical protein
MSVDKNLTVFLNSKNLTVFLNLKIFNSLFSNLKTICPLNFSKDENL